MQHPEEPEAHGMTHSLVHSNQLGERLTRHFVISRNIVWRLTAVCQEAARSLTTTSRRFSALYFPWVKWPDPLEENRVRGFPPSGFVAGLYARNDCRVETTQGESA
jgi:hypothetical protein